MNRLRRMNDLEWLLWNFLWNVDFTLPEFLRFYRRTLTIKVYAAESRKSTGDSAGVENYIRSVFTSLHLLLKLFLPSWMDPRQEHSGMTVFYLIKGKLLGLLLRNIFPIHNTQYTIHNTQYTIHNTQYTLLSTYNLSAETDYSFFHLSQLWFPYDRDEDCNCHWLFWRECF